MCARYDDEEEGRGRDGKTRKYGERRRQISKSSNLNEIWAVVSIQKELFHLLATNGLVAVGVDRQEDIDQLLISGHRALQNNRKLISDAYPDASIWTLNEK